MLRRLSFIGLLGLIRKAKWRYVFELPQPNQTKKLWTSTVLNPPFQNTHIFHAPIYIAVSSETIMKFHIKLCIRDILIRGTLFQSLSFLAVVVNAQAFKRF